MARKRALEGEHLEAEQLTNAGEQAAAAAFRVPVLWVENQAKAFDHFEEIARRWLDRRREALDATRQSFDEMRGCDDFGEVVRIQQQWVLGSLQRFTNDLVELSGMAVDLAQSATSQIGRATEETAHDMERAGREFASVAGSKPRMAAG
jgi:hypothetical protein